jgi:hypothetical protein
MLPRQEIDTFLMAVTDAVDFAREEGIADGYTVLLAGLDHAREAEADGETWAANPAADVHRCFSPPDFPSRS